MSVVSNVLLKTNIEPGTRPAPSSTAPRGEAFADVYAAQRKTTQAPEAKSQAKEARAPDAEQSGDVAEIAEDGNLLPLELSDVAVAEDTDLLLPEELEASSAELLDSPLWAMLQEAAPAVDPAQLLAANGYVQPAANTQINLDAELEALNSAKASQPIIALEGAEEELPVLDLAQLAASVETEDSGEEVGFKLETLAPKTLVAQEAAPDNSRLNAIAQAVNNQAAAPARSVAVPGAPLAPQQAGFSEAVLDRVMWMSSQNLKTAHIQLDPAELGRLDVRVNVSGEQTHVIFSSAHANVRDALESQMQRLRELFTQQGLGQPNVDVSDRSPQQERQAAANFSQGAGMDDGQESDAAPINNGEPVQRAVQSGAGLVDYYA